MSIIYNSIPFNAAINMNKNTTEIKQYSGFNKRNSPVFGGCLSPLYMKKSTSITQSITDSNGNVFVYDNGTLLKNNSSVMTMNNVGITSTSLTNISLISTIEVNPEDVVTFAYCNTDATKMAYIVNKSGVYTIHYQSAGVETTVSETIDGVIGAKIFYFNATPFVFFETSTPSIIIYKGSSRYAENITLNQTSNVYFSSMVGGTTFSFTHYPSTTITSAWKAIINVEAIDTDTIGVSFIVTDGNNCMSNSYAILATAFNVYKAYFEEPALDGEALIVDWRYSYPNVFLNGNKKIGYANVSMCQRDYSAATTFYLSGTVTGAALTASFVRNYTPYYQTHTGCTITYTNYVIITSTKDANNTVKQYYADTLRPDTIANASFDFMFGRERIYFAAAQGISGALATDRLLVTSDSELGCMNTGLAIDNGYYSNNNGACVSFNDNWFILYNNRLISGVSSLNHILVSEWNSVDTEDGIYEGQSSDELIYKGYNGHYYKVIDNSNSVTMNYVLNRYLIFNTTSSLNLYDTINNKAYNYSTDWNNRIFFTSSSVSTSYGSVVSAMNAYLENTSSTIASAQFPASIYTGITTSGTIVADHPIQDVAIQIYTASTSTKTSSVTPIYNVTYSNGSTYYESSLSGISYSNLSANVLYNPTIFAKFIASYTNQNMILMNNKAYTLMYYNNVCFLLYYLLSGIDNVTSSFIIQSIPYCISDQKIYKAVYDDGTLTLTQAIVDVSGMTFLGASPYKALFYSPVNKSIYSFNGDATLTLVQEANVINSIDLTAYNSTTYKFYIAANTGLYIIEGDETNGTYCIPSFNSVSAIFFTNGYPTIKLTNGSTYNISYYAIDGYEPSDIDIETCYYGTGNNVVSIFDCWYIKLYNNGSADNGKLTLKIKSLTDSGFQCEEKTIQIKKADWDINGNYYFRYKPRYMRGTGMSLCLASPFPIVDISVSHQDDTNSQLSKFNI